MKHLEIYKDVKKGKKAKSKAQNAKDKAERKKLAEKKKNAITRTIDIITPKDAHRHYMMS